MADFVARLDKNERNGSLVFTALLEISDDFIRESLSQWGEVTDEELQGVVNGWFSNRIQDCVPALNEEMRRYVISQRERELVA